MVYSFPASKFPLKPLTGFTIMDWAINTTGLIITSGTCCGQEAQSASDTSGGRPGTRSCWWMVDQICAVSYGFTIPHCQPLLQQEEHNLINMR